ncbi:MAG: hypothetical protein GX093_01180 [Xanthomonadaceae bacterium]|nr:hypothetical protein [Xanthomonadaceae bacterium]
MPNWKRLTQHLLLPGWRLRSLFPPATLDRIEAAIRDAERAHTGQIRFAVEAALDLPLLLKGVSARERAIDVFSLLRVWDTEHNNGVLIYLLLADHDVEIVADRGIHARVGTLGWEEICRSMEACFHAGEFERGVLLGIEKVGALLAEHFPGQGCNELPDAPVLL